VLLQLLALVATANCYLLALCLLLLLGFVKGYSDSRPDL